MRTLNDYFLTVQLTDVSAPSSVNVAVPDDGNIIKIISVLGGAITTADSAVVTKINGTTVTEAQTPSQDDLASASFYYLGGHEYTISDYEATVLINAGYSDYVTPV